MVLRYLIQRNHQTEWLTRYDKFSQFLQTPLSALADKDFLRSVSLLEINHKNARDWRKKFSFKLRRIIYHTYCNGKRCIPDIIIF